MKNVVMCILLLLSAEYNLLPGWPSRRWMVTMTFRHYKPRHQWWQEESFRRLVQDGRVEGCVLTSCESTGITTNCWTIIDRKTLEVTKKVTPHPKTKEKPQWDGRRGATTIKSNPITTGWVTHKLENTYTTEVYPLEWRFWAPRQAS